MARPFRPGPRRPRATVAALALGLAVMALVGAASPAAAHGTWQRANDEADLVSVDPPTGGLEITVRATGLVVVRAPVEVVVLGYEGEPYLRVTGDRVEENRRSPSSFLNRTRSGTGALPPGTGAAAPDWVVIGDEGEARWHDHRLHRMDPTSTGPLPWRIDLLVGGRAVAVQGVLTPLDRPARWGWWLLGGGLLAAGGTAWRRRAGHRRVLLLGGLVAGALAGLVVAIGVGGPLAWVAVAAALAALGLTARTDAAWSAGTAGLLVAVLGASELGDLGYAAVFVTVPDRLYRAAVVVCVTLGAGLAVAALDVTRRGGFSRSG